MSALIVFGTPSNMNAEIWYYYNNKVGDEPTQGRIAEDLETLQELMANGLIRHDVSLAAAWLPVLGRERLEDLEDWQASVYSPVGNLIHHAHVSYIFGVKIIEHDNRRGSIVWTVFSTQKYESRGDTLDQFSAAQQEVTFWLYYE